MQMEVASDAPAVNETTVEGLSGQIATLQERIAKQESASEESLKSIHEKLDKLASAQSKEPPRRPTPSRVSAPPPKEVRALVKEINDKGILNPMEA